MSVNRLLIKSRSLFKIQVKNIAVLIAHVDHDVLIINHYRSCEVKRALDIA